MRADRYLDALLVYNAPSSYTTSCCSRQGKFDPRVLAGAVPVGGATGLVLGIFLVLYSIPIVNFIVIMYPIAALITWGSTEEFVNIAW